MGDTVIIHISLPTLYEMFKAHIYCETDTNQ